MPTCSSHPLFLPTFNSSTLSASPTEPIESIRDMWFFYIFNCYMNKTKCFITKLKAILVLIDIGWYGDYSSSLVTIMNEKIENHFDVIVHNVTVINIHHIHHNHLLLWVMRRIYLYFTIIIRVITPSMV